VVLDAHFVLFKVMTNLAALGASVAAYNTVFSNLSNYV